MINTSNYFDGIVPSSVRPHALKFLGNLLLLRLLTGENVTHMDSILFACDYFKISFGKKYPYIHKKARNFVELSKPRDV